MTLEQAALGIHRVLNAQMAEGIRLVSIRQGLDPRRFALMPLGGGGAVHATALARDLSITRVLVPRHPGILSASGLLAAPVEHEMATAFGHSVADSSLADIRTVLDGLDAACRDLMAREQLNGDPVTIRYAADVCYVGQSYTLEVPLRMDESAPLDRLYDDFLVDHDRVYGHATRIPARIVNLRAVHQAGGGGLEGAMEWQPGSPEKAPGGCWWPR